MAAPKHGVGPIEVEETPGKKAYCTCGWSQTLPYCDGAHNRMVTGCRPIKLEIETPGKRWVCQCHRSRSMPWCDDSHKTPAPPQDFSI